MKTTESLRSSVRRILGLGTSPRPRARRFLGLLLAAFGVAGPAAAQPPFYRQELLPGLSSFDAGVLARPALADLDGDGDADLALGGSVGTTGRILYFANVRNAATPLFRERPGVDDPWAGISFAESASPALADLENVDGDLDLVVGDGNGQVRYFRNSGTVRQPIFLELTGAASPFVGADVGADSAPALADLDGDGDRDAAVGAADGTVFYFENTGNAAAPAFAARTGSANPFAGIDVGSSSTPALADLDGDGDADLAVGALVGGVRYFANTGSSSAPAFVAVTGSGDPFTAVPGQPSVFLTGPHLADLEGDGDLDLLVGESGGGLLTFRNTGGPGAPVFVAETGSGAPFGGLIVHREWTTVALADLDDDGDADVAAAPFTGSLRYFRNSGGPRLPSFLELMGTANPLAGLAGAPYPTADFADVDADGDLDLVVGGYGGGRFLAYFQNTGNATAAAFVTVPSSANPFASLPGGDLAPNAPRLADLDGDFDLDLAVGNFVLLYYKNTGNPATPRFAAQTGAANPFQGLDVGIGGWPISPELKDVDLDGDLDLAFGSFTGAFAYAVNTGSEFAPAYSQAADPQNPFRTLDIGGDSNPRLADFDGDGDLDLLSGDGAGHVVYFANVAGLAFEDDFESGDTRNWSQTLP